MKKLMGVALMGVGSVLAFALPSLRRYLKIERM
jgi:hypothetical protein